MPSVLDRLFALVEPTAALVAALACSGRSGREKRTITSCGRRRQEHIRGSEEYLVIGTE